MLTVKFMGHACFTATDGVHKIIIDPFLRGNSQAASTPEEIDVEAVLVTHAHRDHLGDAVEIAKRNDAVVIGVSELTGYCKAQGCRTHPMQIGGSHEFEFGTVKLTPALHGSSLMTDSGVMYMGLACGFVVGMGERSFYHAGDTALFGDMKMMGDLNDLELSILPIGDNYTMGIDDAVIAAKWMKANFVIPMHYNTFDEVKTDVQDFKRKVEDEKINCVVLNPGEEFLVP
jgi:L-ascorbate metabolism protein UlaG (beta-lactamase superfamily)